MKKRILSYSASLVFIFLLWYFISAKINASLILPTPFQVLKTASVVFSSDVFWQSLGATILRVVVSFTISVLLGAFTGYLMSLSEYVKYFLDLPLTIVQSTPVIAVIMIALFWFQSGFVPVFVAVLMALPVVTISVLKGFETNDDKLLFMAEVYNFSRFQKFKYIKLQKVKPHFLGAVKTSFGLCWKVVAAGEVLSLPKYGLGTIMNKAQVHLETSQVIAITVVLILLSFVIEKILGVLLKNEL